MQTRAFHIFLFCLWCGIVSALYMLVPVLDHVIFLAVAICVAVVLFLHAIPEFLVYQYTYPAYLESIAHNPKAVRIFVYMSVASTSLLASATFMYLIGESANGEPALVWSYEFLQRLATWLVIWWTWQFYAGGVSLWIARRFQSDQTQTLPFTNPIRRAISRRSSSNGILYAHRITVPRTCLQKPHASATASASEPPLSS